MIEDVAEIFPAALHVDWHPDGARFCDCEQKRERNRTVADHQRDRIARDKSDAPHPDRERVRHAVEFAEGQRRAFVAREQTGRIRLRAPGEQRQEPVIRIDHAVGAKAHALARAARRAARSAKKRRIVSCGSPDA